MTNEEAQVIGVRGFWRYNKDGQNFRTKFILRLLVQDPEATSFGTGAFSVEQIQTRHHSADAEQDRNPVVLGGLNSSSASAVGRGCWSGP
jgi:hypothetical protein